AAGKTGLQSQHELYPTGGAWNTQMFSRDRFEVTQLTLPPAHRYAGCFSKFIVSSHESRHHAPRSVVQAGVLLRRSVVLDRLHGRNADRSGGRWRKAWRFGNEFRRKFGG